MTIGTSPAQPDWGDWLHGERVIACPPFEELSAYFDGELPDREMRALRNHLGSCNRCAALLADFRRIHVSVNADDTYALPRSFVLTEEMIAPHRQPATVSRFSDFARRTAALPVIAAIAAVLLLAVIGGDVWTHRGGSSANQGGEPRVVMIGGVPVEVDEDDNASFGAASAGAMNGNGASAEADTGPTSTTPAADSSDSTPWWNWWRAIELALGLTVGSLVVTILSRRQPRHPFGSETSPS